LDYTKYKQNINPAFSKRIGFFKQDLVDGASRGNLNDVEKLIQVGADINYQQGKVKTISY